MQALLAGVWLGPSGGLGVRTCLPHGLHQALDGGHSQNQGRVLPVHVPPDHGRASPREGRANSTPKDEQLRLRRLASADPSAMCEVQSGTGKHDLAAVGQRDGVRHEGTDLQRLLVGGGGGIFVGH